MTKIHHLFVIDPIENLNLQLDSSLRMAHALCNIGHSVFVCTPSQLEWLSYESCATAWAQELGPLAPDMSEIKLATARRLKLDFFRAIHMRKDPPYDLNYIASTWLLDSAVARGVRVYNSPAALRNLNEKLSIFRFPESIRTGFVAADPNQLLSFIKNEADGDAILKPLTLFGGRGVIRLNLQTSSEAEVLKILREETQNGLDHRLLQAFDQRIFQGEVRAFTLNGKALCWCLKRPPNDNFLANTRSGASLESYTPSQTELAKIEAIAGKLVAEGVYLIGFDVIAGNISEINITSPRLLHGPNDDRPYYQEFALELARDLS